MEELLQKLIAKVYEVNENTEHDVCFHLSGSSNNFDVFYYRNGYNNNKEITNLTENLIEPLTEEAITRAINELEKLEKGEDNNVQ